MYQPTISRTPRPARRAAFTLIELLVVIAIIAILASILFPVFARARENARRSSCQSNLKQMGLGVQQYSQDYDERFPLAAYGLSGCNALNPCTGWAFVIGPYLKSAQIFQCPSQPNRDQVTAVVDSDNPGYSDYFYNINLGYFSTSGTCPNVNPYAKFSVSQSEIDFASNVVMTGDGGRGGSNNMANYPPLTAYTAGQSYSTLSAPTDNTTRPIAHYVPGWFTCENDSVSPAINNGAYSDGKYLQRVIDTHLEGMNIGFIDGHVKWLKPAKLSFDDPSGSNATFKVNTLNGGPGAGHVGCA